MNQFLFKIKKYYFVYCFDLLSEGFEFLDEYPYFLIFITLKLKALNYIIMYQQ